MKGKYFDVVIIGAGLSGLSCARAFQEKNANYLLLEASGRPGGRVKTDIVDGFILNRGFQVLQTAYPEAKKVLDFDALDLRRFAPGAIFRIGGRFHTVADPARAPGKILQSFVAPIGSFIDRARMIRLALRLSRASDEAIFREKDMPTAEFLRKEGFSERMIHRFFVPFFSGVCLDPEIGVSSRVFKYIFKMFARGDIAVPALGMEEIPKQIAGRIPQNRILTNCRVRRIDKGVVESESGEEFFCKAVVLAVEAPEAERLLNLPRAAESRGEHCLYFEAPNPPFREPFLVIDAEGRGPINNLCVLDAVSSAYAPPGSSLVSVTVVMDFFRNGKNLEEEVRKQLAEWYGKGVGRWRLLKTYNIRHALSGQKPPAPYPANVAGQVKPGVFVCGEYRSLPSIQWALLTGRLTAEKVWADLKKMEIPRT